MKFCSKCGKKLNGDTKFCVYCGNLLKVTADPVKSTNKKQESEACVSNITPMGKKTKIKATLKKIVFCFAWAVIWLFIGMGFTWFSMTVAEHNKQWEESQKERAIRKTLVELGNQSFGGSDASTVNYSMALGFISKAALAKPDLYHFSESGSEEAIEDAFEILEGYFENDYAGTYAALLFGADYFDKEDVEYFYNGTKMNVHQMKEDVEEIMFRSGVSLASLLVDEEDKVICMNLSLRIKMAEDGYISTKDIISDLYDFTYGGVGFRVVSDEKLLEEITYKELTRDIDEAFEGKKVYYDELSPVGKMVFLYIMPRCVVQFDQAAGSELWYHYFMKTYESVWDSIIDRDIFENVVQF